MKTEFSKNYNYYNINYSRLASVMDSEVKYNKLAIMEDFLVPSENN